MLALRVPALVRLLGVRFRAGCRPWRAVRRWKPARRGAQTGPERPDRPTALIRRRHRRAFQWLRDPSLTIKIQHLRNESTSSFRSSAKRTVAYWQLSRGVEELGGDSGSLRMHFLHRRSACDYGLSESSRAF